MKRFKNLFRMATSRFWFLLLIIGGILGAFSILFFFPDTSTSQIGVVKIAAISALFATIGSLATAIQTLEAQKQREALERPSVVVFFDISASGEIYFIVENISNSPAVDVVVEFSPPVETILEGLTLGFANPISFLPPGKSIRQFYGYGHSIIKKDEENILTANLKYTSIDDTRYEDIAKFNLSYLWGITFPEKSINESLKDISLHLSRIAHGTSSYRAIMSPPTAESSLQLIADALNKITAILSDKGSDIETVIDE